MKRLLVIGAGYLGEEILRIFRNEGWDVRGVSLRGGDGLLACDVGDPAQVAGLPDADAVIHCAASGRGGEEAYRRVYVDGCRNLLQRFLQARLLFTSSSSVYSQTDGSTVDEHSSAVPERETGRLLLEAEKLTLAGGGIVVRLAGIYGPERSVILKKFLAGEAVIEEDGSRFLNMIHRDDAARAILHLLTKEKFPAGEIFNVSDTRTRTQQEIYEGLAQFFNRELPPVGPRDVNRKRGWTNKIVSNQKLLQTGWRPIFPDFLDALGSEGEIRGVPRKQCLINPTGDEEKN